MKLFSLLRRYKAIAIAIAIAIGLGILILLINEGEVARALSQPELNSSGSTESTSMESDMKSDMKSDIKSKIYTIIQQARDSWVNRDANAFACLFTSNGEFLVPGNHWVGQDAIRQVAADFAASSSNVTIEIRRIIVEGNQAAVEWHWEDTNSSGYHNQADDVIVIDFINGKISRWREYIDTQTPKR